MGRKNGKFGDLGGRFVPETLMGPLLALEKCYAGVRRDPGFRVELAEMLKHYCGRPTPLYHAVNFSRHCGAKVYLKREDLNPTGAHKITNALGQALIARRMGKKRLVAETGAGQHGVAVATVAALLGFRCTVYMGEIDARRQAPNLARMRLLGAEIVEVTAGSKTLKDATSEAMRDWVATVRDTHYLLGSAVGPHPFPTIVRDLQSVIGRETRRQILHREGKLPRALVAAVGGGSNSIGLFHPFIKDVDVALIGVEAGGQSSTGGLHSMSLGRGRRGVLHGAHTYLLQDTDGQIQPTHSIAAGLDYPGVGPELAHLMECGRITVGQVEDGAALDAAGELARLEGIIPALESAHALAWLAQNRHFSPQDIVVVNVSGRGDKDISMWSEHHAAS